MLTGRMVRAPFAPARILSIDTSEAEKLPGVKCILTPKDFAWAAKVGNGEFAAEFADKEVLCTEIVRQVGDDVAAVAAVDEETAQRAVELIKVEYEKLPGVYDPFDAMEEGAPEVNWEGKGLHNIGMQSHMCAGTNIDEEFESAAYVQHRDYSTHRMVHAAMEPHGAVATYRNGTYNIWMSTQMAYVDQFWYARCLGVPENHVRVIKPLVGGAFGGKLDSYSFGLCAAKMAELTQRPVRMILTREEVFQTTRNRHPIYMHIDTAFAENGKMLAKKCYHVLDGGPYGGSGVAAYEHNITKEGKILNPNFRDYRFPTALDMPKMRTFYDFTPDEEGPLGAKEAGEGSAAPVAPAIANAVNMATGVYFTSLPLDPEHIWRALNGMEDDRYSK